MSLESSLHRLTERIAQQEILAAVDRARRHHERHGLTFTEEDAAAVAAFHHHQRTWPAGLGLEEQIQRAAA